MANEESSDPRGRTIKSASLQVYRFKLGGDRKHAIINYTDSECSMEKLEGMQWSVV